MRPHSYQKLRHYLPQHLPGKSVAGLLLQGSAIISRLSSLSRLRGSTVPTSWLRYDFVHFMTFAPSRFKGPAVLPQSLVGESGYGLAGKCVAGLRVQSSAMVSWFSWFSCLRDSKVATVPTKG